MTSEVARNNLYFLYNCEHPIHKAITVTVKTDILDTDAFLKVLKKMNRICSPLFAQFIPVKINLRHVIIPTSYELAVNDQYCCEVARAALAFLAFFLIDIPTLLIRLVALIPRYYYNKSYMEEKKNLLAQLNLLGVRNEWKPSNILVSTDKIIKYASDKKEHCMLMDFSVEPIGKCEVHRQHIIQDYYHYDRSLDVVVKSEGTVAKNQTTKAT